MEVGGPRSEHAFQVNVGTAVLGADEKSAEVGRRRSTRRKRARRSLRGHRPGGRVRLTPRDDVICLNPFIDSGRICQSADLSVSRRISVLSISTFCSRPSRNPSI